MENFVTDNQKVEATNMEYKTEMSLDNNNGILNEESDEGFWEREMAKLPTSEEYLPWYEVKGYNKFRSVTEMTEPKAFFALLIRNDRLRNKSFQELKDMAKKYAEGCRKAEIAAKEETDRRVFEKLREKGFSHENGFSCLSYERSCGMYKEETEKFMEYVREAEWLQYIEQTAEEIEQIIMDRTSSLSIEPMIENTIEDYERMIAAELERMSCFPDNE